MADLTTLAPAGSHFEFGEVSTAKGTQSLGPVPILVWDDIDAAVVQYTAEGISDILDGTSLRVSFQAISRRMKLTGKSDEEIAAAQVAFRPGKRAVGASTPTSRAKTAVGRVIEKLGADKADALAELLRKIEAGEITL